MTMMRHLAKPEQIGAFKTLSRTKLFLIILMFILLIGVFIGTLAYCSMDGVEISKVSLFTQGFIKDRTEQTFLQTLSDSFSVVGLMLLTISLLGFSAIAQPIEFAIPLIRGIGLGTSIAYIYATYGVKGIFIVLTMIIPHAVLSSIAIIIAARESIRSSNAFTSVILGRSNETPGVDVKLYLLKFLILFVIIGLSAIIDSILTFVFAGVLLTT